MRLARFALSFALGFFLVTLLSLLLLIAQVAPGRSTVPFMGIAIALVAWFAVLFSRVTSVWSLSMVLSPLIGVATVALLLAGTRKSLKVFSCGVSALSAFLLVLTLFHSVLNLRVTDY